MAIVGSKAGSWALPKLLGWMPTHRRYLEPFLGHGALLLNKRPAPDLDIGIDLSPSSVLTVAAAASRLQRSPIVMRGDGVRLLRKSLAWAGPDWLFFLDPPYLVEDANRVRGLYEFEMETEAHHAHLLTIALCSRARIMISGYPTRLYQEMLTPAAGWRCESYQAMTRKGPRIECCWMNFPLHAPRHHPHLAGGSFRERQRRQRKAGRWARRFAGMCASERQLIAEALSAAAKLDTTNHAGDIAGFDDAGLVFSDGPSTAAVKSEGAMPNCLDKPMERAAEAKRRRGLERGKFPPAVLGELSERDTRC